MIRTFEFSFAIRSPCYRFPCYPHKPDAHRHDRYSLDVFDFERGHYGSTPGVEEQLSAEVSRDGDEPRGQSHQDEIEVQCCTCHRIHYHQPPYGQCQKKAERRPDESMMLEKITPGKGDAGDHRSHRNQCRSGKAVEAY